VASKLTHNLHTVTIIVISSLSSAVDQNQLSDRLKRYLGCAAALAAARAHKHNAVELHAQMQVGVVGFGLVWFGLVWFGLVWLVDG